MSERSPYFQKKNILVKLKNYLSNHSKEDLFMVHAPIEENVYNSIKLDWQSRDLLLQILDTYLIRHIEGEDTICPH